MAKKDENKARFGMAASHPAEQGRVVVVHHDTEHDGETYKAGVQDLPVEVADALLKAEDDLGPRAFEPEGKKRGR